MTVLLSFCNCLRFFSKKLRVYFSSSLFNFQGPAPLFCSLVFRSVINILSHSFPFVNTFFYFFQSFFDSRFFCLSGSGFANLSAFLASPLGFFLCSPNFSSVSLAPEPFALWVLPPFGLFPSSLSLPSPFFAASLYYHISSPFVNYFFHVFCVNLLFTKIVIELNLNSTFFLHI